MRAEILMIGTELLIGQIHDTNATHIAKVLAENGINLYQKTTIGDNLERIKTALHQALERSDIVLCSGGLGPTEDDITREAIAKLLDFPLQYHDDLFDDIKARFARIRMNITENNKKQATLPQGANPIPNPNGTAPGLILEHQQGTIICMPGVPHELIAMLEDSVLPYLRKRFDLHGVLHYRILKVCGMGESRVDQAIKDLIGSHANPTIGLLASPEAVSIRIAANAESINAANELIDSVEAQLRKRLPGRIMGVNDDTLESVVDRLLTERRWTLALCETNTGGMLAQKLTAANATAFIGARIIPSADPGQTTTPENALELAQQTRLEFSTDCALALLADETDAQTHIAWIAPDGSQQWTVGYAGKNHKQQRRTSVIALENVRRLLIETVEQ